MLLDRKEQLWFPLTLFISLFYSSYVLYLQQSCTDPQNIKCRNQILISPIPSSYDYVVDAGAQNTVELQGKGTNFLVHWVCIANCLGKISAAIISG